MKIGSKILSLLLCAAMLVGLLPSVAQQVRAYSETDIAYPVEGGNIYFNKENGTITDCDKTVTSATIPEEIDGIAVTKMGTDAFAYCSALESVVIPETITEIPSRAFTWCDALTDVEIPSCVTKIGNYAFAYCQALTAFTIPDSVTTLGENVFASCALLSDLKFSENLTAVGKFAFMDCDSLKSMEFPEGLLKIGDFVLLGCEKLESVRIPASVIEIGEEPFSQSSALKEIRVDEENKYYASDSCGALFDKEMTTLFAFPAGYSGVYTIPDGVEKIHSYAFSYCNKITEVKMCDSLITISNSAFFDCESLARVEIPDSVTTIGDFAFGHCDALTELTLGDSLQSIGMSAFLYCVLLKDFEIPASVSSLSNSALSNCTALEKIELPKAITSIEASLFSGCLRLTTVIIPTEVTQIKDSAFYNCENFTDVYYYGSEEMWNEITIEEYNDPLLNATIHFNYEPSEEPSEDPTEPSVEPTEPSVEPTEPSEIPSEKPEEPTEPSETPSEKPEEPTEPSETPTEKPEEPTEPSEKPTERPEPVIPTENPFKDVKKSDYFCDPVLWAVGKGITNGMSATSFAPNANCTRGQIVTFLWRACGSPEPAKKDNPFKDVKSNEYYYKAVLWAVENGITTGLSATTFGPNATCTRGQVATFLWRSQGEPAPKSTNNPFKDVKSSDYYFKAVLWAVENEVTQGMGGGKFAPNASCTRGQIVTFLYRAIV